jgi:hypothetical protein
MIRRTDGGRVPGQGRSQAVRFGDLPRVARRRITRWFAIDGTQARAALARDYGVRSVTTGVRKRAGAIRPDLEEVLKFWVDRKRPEDRVVRPVDGRVVVDVPRSLVRPSARRSRETMAVSFSTDVVSRRIGRTQAASAARIRIENPSLLARGCVAARLAWAPDGANGFAWLTAAHVLTLGRMSPSGPLANLQGPSATDPTGLGAVIPRSCWRNHGGHRLDAGLLREDARPVSLLNSVAASVAGFWDTSGIGVDSVVMLVDQDDDVQDLQFHAWSDPGDVVLRLDDGTRVEYGRCLLFRGATRKRDSGTCAYVVSGGRVLLVGILAGKTGDGDVVIVPNETIRASLQVLHGSPLSVKPM